MRIKKAPSHLDPIFNSEGLVKIHPEMKQFLGFCLYKLAMSIRARLDEECKEHGVIAPQCAMLKLLSASGSMTQSELGKFLAIDKATMVRFIDSLENQALLKRSEDPNDRRAKLLQITAKGRALLDKIHAARNIAEGEMLKPLNATEQKQFRTLVAKLTL